MARMSVKEYREQYGTPKKKGKYGHVKKVTFQGIEFDSKLELYFYKVFKAEGFIVKRRTESIMLHKGFNRYDLFERKNVKERPITYKYDFDLEVPFVDRPISVETKGHAERDYALRRKMYIKLYKDKMYFVQLNSEEEVLKFLNVLKQIKKDKER